MKLTLEQARRVVLSFLLIIASLVVGYYVGQRRLKINVIGNRPSISIDRNVPVEKQNLNFGLFWEVWDKVEQNYWDKGKIDPTKLVYGAIKGMVEAVGDPYTVFLSPNEQKRSQQDLEGNFDGIGVQIGYKGSQLAVIAPLKDSPAEKAGIKSGDFIVWIKDEGKNIDKSTVGMPLPEAVDLIRGPSGTVVKLTITREGIDKPLEISVVRSTIEVPSVDLSFENEGKIAHLKLYRFGEQTTADWDTKVNMILAKKSQLKGIVLDLRDNPGGLLTESVNLSSEFIQKGVILIQENGRGEKQSFQATGKGRLYDLPLVVLINKGSASASEIMAGALRDNKRAKLVGETTFGKGTIQEAEELPDGAGLHITTARWLTPSGFWVDQKGIEPDVKVLDNPDTKEDEQLQKAMEILGV